MKSYLGNFYRHLAIFIWSHWLCCPHMSHHVSTKNEKQISSKKCTPNHFIVFKIARIIVASYEVKVKMSETRLCFQYLAIYSNENLPKSIQIVPNRDKQFTKNKITLNILRKIIKYLPKVSDFAKLEIYISSKKQFYNIEH